MTDLDIAQQLINGLMQGSLYALLAIGFTLIFSVIGMLNMAHGEVFMVSGFMTYFLLVYGGLPLYLTFPLAIIFAALIGMLVELICFRPINKSYHFSPLVATIALGIVISETVTNLFGSDPKFIPKELAMPSFSIAHVIISSSQILLLSLTLVAMFAISFLLEKTKLGRAMRTLAESEKAAKLLGVPINRVITITFIIASMLAGLAGLLFTFRFEVVSPMLGFTIGLKGLAVMMVGGMGNVYGAMLTGVLIGLMESIVIGLPYGLAPYVDAIVWGAMILVLLFRPSGLLGSRIQTERV